MKSLILASLLAMSLMNTAMADIENAPFMPEIDRRFDALEQGNHIKQGLYPQGAADGHYVKQYVKATYDFTTMGGASTVHDLGVSIPANAVETRSWVYDIVQPVTNGSGAVIAFYCAGSVSNPDLKQPIGAGAYPAAGKVADGTQSGAATQFSTVASKCEINAAIQTGAITAGKIVLFVEYSIHQ